MAGQATIRSVSGHNKNGSWTTVQLTKVLTQETAAQMGIRLTTQDYRNVAIDIGCEYIRAEFMREIPITEEMLHEDMDVVVSAVDLAAAHGKEIAERYGGGFLTLASLSWAGNETESWFELMMLLSWLRPKAAQTRVLQLAKVPTYSEEELYEGLKKVLN
ncbi:hypothetical protein VE02_09774 [Pseudogymnoascus sp. 03VT05]|nr:hypothetical protein VE02_09774 [Pseudogymnoascus sp. 03VT05]